MKIKDISLIEIAVGAVVSIAIGFYWKQGQEAFVVGMIFMSLWILAIRQRNQIED